MKLCRVVTLVLVLLGVVRQASAETLIWVRDAEIESGVTRMTRSLFKAAKLDPSSVRIVILRSDDINAQVLPGGTILIFTGLLLSVTSPEQILAIIAHETGHLRGGHHVRRWLALEKGGATLVAGLLLGGVAAALGSPELMAATLSGSQHVAERSFLGDSRDKEHSADQATVDLLAKLNLPPVGMAEFMRVLQRYEPGFQTRDDAFRSTHPRLNDRIAFFENAEARSPFQNRRLPKADHDWFARMQTKLRAAFDRVPNESQGGKNGGSVDSSLSAPPTETLACYGWAIRQQRQGNLEIALAAAQRLLTQSPKDPYFLELKGQILLESGKSQAAADVLAHAVAVQPDSALLLGEYAHALIESAPASPNQEPSETLSRALEHLKKAYKLDPENPLVLHDMAVVYGRLGKRLGAILAMIEKALSEDDLPQARQQIERARNIHTLMMARTPALPADEHKAYLKIQDIESSLKAEEKARQR